MTPTQHYLTEMPVLVLSPHNRCNCRCVMCDIWKIRQVRELSESDLRPHLESLRELGVKWVVFTGGEPLLHHDLTGLCRLFREANVRLSLLSSGLLLEKHAGFIVEWLDDVIVSLDGPAEVHDDVRGIRGAHRELSRGISAIRQRQPDFAIRARCTVQKKNSLRLRDTVQAAHDLNVLSISFLAADVNSSAFNRSEPWPADRRNEVALDAAETEGLAYELEELIREYQEDINSGFIVERPEKLRSLAVHFRARIGEAEAVSPRCNAPWVSAVVDADGSVRPCFFHPPFGNLAEAPLADVLNSEPAVRFRQSLDVPTNPTCRQCVCSLLIMPAAWDRGQSLGGHHRGVARQGTPTAT